MNRDWFWSTSWSEVSTETVYPAEVMLCKRHTQSHDPASHFLYLWSQSHDRKTKMAEARAP